MPAKPFLRILLFLCFQQAVQAVGQSGFDKVEVNYHITGKDTSFNTADLNLQRSFNSDVSANNYIAKLQSLLSSRGFPAASVDSVWRDSQHIHLSLYLGRQFELVQLIPVNIDKKALEESGFRLRNMERKNFNLTQMQKLKERLLHFYENNGYPFASVYFDSITIEDHRFSALLKVDQSAPYTLDSIRVIGSVKLNKSFIENYLDIPSGSLYNAEKLSRVDKRISDLSFASLAQPAEVSMLGSGAVLNIYLKPRKTNQFNFLVGFLPSSSQPGKIQLTGEVNLDLKNAFGGGETFLLNWQQLQVKSPRLNIGFGKPYLFHSKFGFDFQFNLFKKDSSYIQVEAQVGTRYDFSASRFGKLYLQWQNSSLLSGGVDTTQIKLSKKLPLNIDVNAVNMGLEYAWNNTNYRYNPLHGNDWIIASSVGLKKIRENFDIVGIRDPGFNYRSLYDSLQKKLIQIRIKSDFSHFFQTGNSSTLRAGLSLGTFISPKTFRNELFQLGGYKLLRGFNDQSIFSTSYGVLTAEYRYLVDVNSYLYFFSDAALTWNKYQFVDTRNKFISGGIGMVYETKFGLLNIAYAAGNRDDVPFNLREASKLHVGYINYF